MIAAITSALGIIIGLSEKHPEVAKALASELRDLISGHEDATLHSLEAQRALASGIAARCAVAVQEANRRRKLAESAVPAASAITKIRERLEQSANQTEQAALAFALDVVTNTR